ncbi:universal stress protein [Halocalculus aciditolerans]|uniref:Universal stress protein UspA n=1 Tax=Halocalculus aciditolerans TaxID=1383812 RepID=A0A830FFK3_9EURY|nr:universal stress protein [Halocalculus aciditolerans]GGL69646.1 universal stress protein UspA [Halocalculus aciditolerans]
MTLDVDLVLVPVDGSDASATAAEYAVAVAEKYDADVHALYVLDDQVARDIEAGTVEEAAVADDVRAFVDDIRELAPDTVDVKSTTANAFSTTRKRTTPGDVILDTAEAVDVDFLVVPHDTTETTAPSILEKAAEHVLLYASQPVLSV